MSTAPEQSASESVPSAAAADTPQPMGSGEMATRIQSFDWHSNPLGPLDKWPQTLRIAVNLCLANRFPMMIFWGPRLITNYNDAYSLLLGHRHPEALGRSAWDVWPENWTALEPEINAVVERGHSTYIDSIPIVSHRNGQPEQICLSWSCSPILNEDGSVGGVLNVCSDQTRRMQAEAERDRLEQELNNMRARVESTLAAAEVGTWTWDVNTNRVSTDRNLARMFGLSPAAAGNGQVDAWLQAVHPEDRESVAARIFAVLASDQSFEVEYRLIGPDGHLKWVTARGRVERDERGMAVRVTGVVMDVTARKQAEAALHDANVRLEDRVRERTAELAEMNAKFQAIYDQGLFAAFLDLRGTVIDANRSCLETCGFTRADVVGKPFWECGWWNRSAVVQTWIRDGFAHALRGEPFRGETPYFCADGSQRIVEFAMMPIKDGAGRVLFILPTGIDVTDRRLAEQERQATAIMNESGARFRQLAETIPQLAWMANPDGSVFWYNRRWFEYTGTTLQQVQGWGWQAVHDPELLPHVLEEWKRSLATGESFEMEFPLRRADGAFRWFLTRVAPLRDANGHILLWFGTNTDIEDRRRAAEERVRLLEAERAARTEAERTSRLKDEFLATLGHELRTPLNAILGWSQILAGPKRTVEDLDEGLRTIERNARAQTQIIEDLLDMSRIVSGKLRLDVQRVDLSSVVAAAVETLRHAADAKGVRLHVVLDPHTGPVSGDPNRLQQVFWNLLTNAIKFTPRGGRVQVLLERVNSHVEISVADTGEGIDPDFLPFVFDRFRQSDASTTRRHGGLGIGLAIVRQLAELHGGTVRVKSPGAGQGATFTVSLPLAVVHPDPEPQTERRHPRSASVPVVRETCDEIAGVKVVIADDEPDARALVKRFLEDCKAVVTVAASAAEALQLLQSERPDVLISDIGMSGEDGYALIKQVRALPAERGGNTPAIALTAYARAEDRVKAVKAGFQHHIAKPVEAAELIAIIASLTRQKR